MGMTGTFLADFSPFLDATEKATVKLKTFSDGAGTASARLTTMSNSLQGTAIVQQATIAAEAVERLGGVTKLTEAELARVGATAAAAVEKIRAMGDDVPPKIQALADAAKHAGDSFGAWTSKFDIKQAINEPLATAKSGVLAFVETLGPTGIALGVVAAAGSALGGALLELGNDAEAVGQQIGRMGVQFNIPAGAVSDLRFAIHAAGGDFDTFGNSMFTFQKRIEDNGAAVEKGLQQIGLSLAGVKALRPDEQFLAISDALRTAGGNTNKAAVAFEIFGRQGKDILPLLLKPLSDLNEESARLGATWSEVDVAAARAFGLAQTKMAAESEEAWTSLGRSVAPTTDTLVLGWDRMKLAVANVANLFPAASDAIRHLTGSTGDLASAEQAAGATQDATTRLFAAAAAQGLDYAAQVRQVATSMLDMGYSQKTVAAQTGLTSGQVRELAGELKTAANESAEFSDAWGRINTAFAGSSLEGVSASTRGLVADMRDAGISAADMAAATGLTIVQIKLLEASEKDAKAALKAFSDAVGEVASAGTSLQTTLDTIDGSLLDNIRNLTAAGVSMKTIEAYYGLTATQGKALTEMIKADSIAVEQNKVLWDQWAAGVVRASGTARDVALANIQKISSDMTAKRQQEGTADAAYYSLRAALDKQATDAILTDHDRVAKGSIEALQQEAAKQQATLDDMLSGRLHYKREAIDAQIAVRDAAVDALHYTASEHAAVFEQMRNDVDKTSFAYRSWLANVATDAEKAAIALQEVADETKKDEEAARDADKAEAASQQGSTVDYSTVEGQRIAHAPNAATQFDYIKMMGIEAGGKAWADLQAAIIGGAKILHDKGVPGFEGGGPTGGGGLSMLHPDEFVVPKSGALVMAPDRNRATNINVNVSGLLVGNSPSGRAEFAQFVSDAIVPRLMPHMRFGS